MAGGGGGGLRGREEDREKTSSEEQRSAEFIPKKAVPFALSFSLLRSTCCALFLLLPLKNDQGRTLVSSSFLAKWKTVPVREREEETGERGGSDWTIERVRQERKEEKKRTNMRVRTAFFCPSRGPFPSPCHALSTSTNLAPRLSNRGSSSAVARAKPAVDRGFPLAASSARGANAAESEGSRRAGGGGIGAVCCIDGLEER